MSLYRASLNKILVDFEREIPIFAVRVVFNCEIKDRMGSYKGIFQSFWL